LLKKDKKTTLILKIIPVPYGSMMKYGIHLSKTIFLEGSPKLERILNCSVNVDFGPLRKRKADEILDCLTVAKDTYNI
jgi:hypothetical protein